MSQPNIRNQIIEILAISENIRRKALMGQSKNAPVWSTSKLLGQSQGLAMAAQSFAIANGITIDSKLLSILKTKDQKIMVYSEKKAESIIHKLLAEGKKICEAIVGLDGDWRANHDTIYSEGKFYKYASYERSFWAIPTMIVTFEDGSNEKYEVWEPEEENNNG